MHFTDYKEDPFTGHHSQVCSGPVPCVPTAALLVWCVGGWMTAALYVLCGRVDDSCTPGKVCGRVDDSCTLCGVCVGG